jgi:hypothetical protein
MYDNNELGHVSKGGRRWAMVVWMGQGNNRRKQPRADLTV